MQTAYREQTSLTQHWTFMVIPRARQNVPTGQTVVRPLMEELAMLWAGFQARSIEENSCLVL